MIYPFTVLNSSKDDSGGWNITIRMSKVLRYEENADPAQQFRNPIIESVEQFHRVIADTEDDAMQEVAKIVHS